MPRAQPRRTAAPSPTSTAFRRPTPIEHRPEGDLPVYELQLRALHSLPTATPPTGGRAVPAPGAHIWEPERRRQTRLRSTTGPTSGRMWTAQAGLPGTALTDAEWEIATKFRLGLVIAPGSYQCQNRATGPTAGDHPGSQALKEGHGCHGLCCPWDPSGMHTTTKLRTLWHASHRKQVQRQRESSQSENFSSTDRPY